ncbi:MAG: hypothetical protein RLZZ403_999 [Pseudomonadota bacterium]|jgi:hypothetical protein
MKPLTMEQRKLALILEAEIALASLNTMGPAVGKVRSDADLDVVIHAVLGFASTSIFAAIRAMMNGPDVTPEKLGEAFRTKWTGGLREAIDKVFVAEIARMSDPGTVERTEALVAERMSRGARKH